MDGAVTVSAIEADPDRACASVIVAGSVFAPGVVASGTAAEKLKVLSPAVTSPFVAVVEELLRRRAADRGEVGR